MIRSTECLTIGTLLLCAPAWAQLGFHIPVPERSEANSGTPSTQPDSWTRLLPDPATRPPLVYARQIDAGSAYSAHRSSGIQMPLSSNLTSLVETSYTELGELGAEWSMRGQIGAEFAPGWSVQAGLRHSEIGLNPTIVLGNETKAGTAQLGSLTLERNWSSLRGAYTLFGSYANSGATGTAQRFELQYYYAPRSNVGLAFTSGRALQPGAPLAGYAPLEGSNLGLTGEHWLSPTWAVNYRALLQDPSFSAGLKPEIRFGLRYAF